MRRSQISVDFIIILVIFLAIFLFIFSTSAKRTEELYGSQKFLSAKEITDKVAFNINNVFLAGNSVSQSFYLPESLRDNTPYTLTIYPTKHIVEIKWANGQYTATLLTSAITGVLNPISGLVTLTNQLGAVNVWQAGASFCGNNIAEGIEVCDGTDLKGQTCISQGFDTGALACQLSCNAFDTSSCYISCQQACINLGFSQWMCRASCGGSWRNPALQGNQYCSPNVCCCK